MSEIGEPTGIVFDIQRAAFQDGPGIRTTVFLKGCPLRCAWCHNPESWRLEPQRVVAGDAEKVYGREMTLAEVMAEVRRDHNYYVASGGGVTISGGEPTVQIEFCRALLRAAKAEGIHTCLDTCGYGRTEVFLGLLPDVDLFLWDYKATGDELHCTLTGVPARGILRNLRALHRHGARILLRCPLVPGVNDMPEHFRAVGTLMRDLPGLQGIEFLPYHETGRGKYEPLGLAAPKLRSHPPGLAEKTAWREAAAAAGLSRASVL
ncbi:MAG TPA: glycyl-radical enzyme activating protein [Verrucomicrobiae bacterium]|nr:glycyl-radical enzyme activating protein [Verrucomicrobiae bacterium]